MKKSFIYQKFRKVSCWISKSLSYYQIFTNQVYRHLIKASKVCERYWEETSVDLFWPLSSTNHIVVIQDIASHYPIAKLVKSTNAKSVQYLKICMIHMEIWYNTKESDPRLTLRKWKTLLKTETLNTRTPFP